MLSRVKNLVLAISVIIFSTAAFSGGYFNTGNYNDDSQAFHLEPSFKVTRDTDESFEHTHKTAYVYAGYEFTYRFLNTSTQTIVDHMGSAINYQVDGNTPNSFHGIEVGLGKAISRYVDLQLAYIQQFRQTKNSTIAGLPSQNTVSMQGLDVNALWIFNPEDQIQVGLKLGARVADFHEKVLINGSDYYPVDDSTEINPRFGLDMNFQINSDISFRTGVAYTVSAYRVFYDGGIDIFAGLSYSL